MKRIEFLATAIAAALASGHLAAGDGGAPAPSSAELARSLCNIVFDAPSHPNAKLWRPVVNTSRADAHVLVPGYRHFSLTVVRGAGGVTTLELWWRPEGSVSKTELATATARIDGVTLTIVSGAIVFGQGGEADRLARAYPANAERWSLAFDGAVAAALAAVEGKSPALAARQ